MEKEYADIDLLLKLLQQGDEKAFRSLFSLSLKCISNTDIQKFSV